MKDPTYRQARNLLSRIDQFTVLSFLLTEAPVPGVLTSSQTSCLADAIAAGYGILAQGRSRPSPRLNLRSLCWNNRDCSTQDEARIASWTGCSVWTPQSMEGARLNAGAVASIEGIVHPITAARLVMEETGHVLLVGPFAGRFAQHFKLDRHRSTGMPRRPSYGRVLARQKSIDTTGRHGTVGAVALIGPGQWRQGPRPEVSIRCCQGGLATARS